MMSVHNSPDNDLSVSVVNTAIINCNDYSDLLNCLAHIIHGYTLNLTIRNNDVLHGLVLRMKSDLLILFVYKIALQSVLIRYQGNNNIAIHGF